MAFEMMSSERFDDCQPALSTPPALVVVVDTEEEFDWSGNFSRQHTSVRAMRAIDRVQALFDAYGITPVYVMDYPVASQVEGYQPLLDIYYDGRCLIGAHLHPWVNPPFDEPVNRVNSFPGNLSPELEAAKLQCLGDTIGERFGSRPRIYKAGRYGLGPHTADILEAQGYEVDVSVCPHMDYAAEGGPDFSGYSARPFWFGRRRRLLELPLTVGFTGLLHPWGGRLHSLASRKAFSRLHAIGILARLGLMNKVWLTPEGYHLDETLTLLRTLYRNGVRVFTFAFHSPSVEPGHTPYVNSQADLERFLDHCRRFFDFFMGDFGGAPTTPLDVKAQMLATAHSSQVEAT